ncbi:MAG TPA: methylated-DNA--[protein]-cysteine S-methyltransferase [Kofleriaceae bacterium]|nr:methylated-DNA--[protein]-cysteine S-methyltransferase [Kofleriaceae bacterium]
MIKLSSPLGGVALGIGDRGLCALEFGDSDAWLKARLERAYPTASIERGDSGRHAIAERVAAYFAGDVRAIDNVPVSYGEGTPFQRAVWRALRDIPAGQTASYADIARRIGRPKAWRAVGAANRANPIAVVVPCHRVITASGKIGGYGGGVPRKEWLLRHEQARLV